ncbi:MAG TPA: PKD domain-containing protein [Flavobacteriales bacterium]|nr:PKD domain-containing protein [Flavobacteriales bacterium]
MSVLLRILPFLAALSPAFGLMAQGPYTINVQGTLANCSPGDSIVVHTLFQGTAVAVNEDCSFSATVVVDTSSGSLVVLGYCGSTTLLTDTVPYTLDPQTTDTTLWVNFDCDVGTPMECEAAFTVEQTTIGGIPIPWEVTITSQSTGDGNLYHDWYLDNAAIGYDPVQAYTFTEAGNYALCLYLYAMSMTDSCVSMACDSIMVNPMGYINQNTWADCEGIVGGPAVPGTPCDDGNPETEDDRWNADCECIGSSCTPLPDELDLTHGLFSAWCSTDSILQGITNITPDMQPVHYTWSGPGLMVSDSLPWVQLFEAGNFHVTVSNACSTAEADFVIAINQAPNAGTSSTVTLCSTGDPFSMFAALGGTPDAGGTWTDPYGNPAPPIFNPATMPPGVYVYTVAGVAPCPYVSATLTVFIDDDQHWYEDADGDGMGDPNMWVIACEQPNGYVGNADDACPVLYGTVGDACNDGNPFTMGDVITAACTCAGFGLVEDCEGVVSGPAMPGTPCTITLGGVPLTGIWAMDCVCDTTTFGPDDCLAGFWAVQAYMADSLNPGGSATPIPHEVWAWNLSSGGGGTLQYLWDFGDGSTSTEAYPTHEYGGQGPYQLCLTVWGANCTDTYCDTIGIDQNGFLNGMLLDSHGAHQPSRTGGFMLRVLPSIPTVITEPPAISGVCLWPNPAEDGLNVALFAPLASHQSLAILDTRGRVVLKSTRMMMAGQQTLHVDLRDLEPGLYLLRIGDGIRASSHRFLKM